MLGRIPYFLLLVASLSQADQLLETNEILVKELPISSERDRLVLMALPLAKLSPEDMLDIRFQAEVTTPHQQPVMVGWEVRYSTDRQRAGHLLIPSVATNVTRDFHHLIIQGSKLVRMPDSLGQGEIVLVAWAARPEASLAPLQIENQGAFLQVRISK